MTRRRICDKVVSLKIFRNPMTLRIGDDTIFSHLCRIHYRGWMTMGKRRARLIDSRRKEWVVVYIDELPFFGIPASFHQSLGFLHLLQKITLLFFLIKKYFEWFHSLTSLFIASLDNYFCINQIRFAYINNIAIQQRYDSHWNYAKLASHRKKRNCIFE